MEQKSQTLAIVPDPKAQVVVLRCPDRLHFDPAPLNQLFSQKDDASAEDVVCRALENIALRLDELQKGLAQSDFSKMDTPARRVAVVAKQIGLTEVAVAGTHVATCVQQSDGIATEATMARLERAFDVAVAEVWNFRDLI